MSSARLARSAFHAAARRATSSAPNAAARAVGRRTMASSAEHGAAKKSDTPWIIGSAIVFGPAFLYLVSPSARKNTPVVHNDKHDYPTSKTLDHPTTPQPTKKVEVVQEEEEAAAPAAPAPAEDSEKVTLKDDEGKEADITASLALAEEANVPKADVSSEKFEATKAEAASEGAAAAPAESAPSGEEAPTESAQKETSS
ncbi:hypothetical protein MD484_g3412, partial [Candolleomyces efflorescens]